MMKTLFASLLLSTTLLAQQAAIRPGEVWRDNRGQPIQAHGGGILTLGHTYYWFGEDREQSNDPSLRYVGCYSSRDLVHWTFRSKITLTDPEHIGPHWILERPHVFYNSHTKKFVMYAHLDGPLPSDPDGRPYKLARVGVFISNKADGPYTFVHSFRPLGQESRDIGQFVDDDGKPYLLFESRPTGGFVLAALSDDYLTVSHQVAFFHTRLEGGALVHVGKTYFVMGSHLSGWASNPNVYASAPSLTGPWSTFANIAAPEMKTYDSQSTFLLKVVGTKTTSVIYMGDRWEPKTLWDSRYVWMPLTVSGTTLTLPAPQPWTINIKTGETHLIPSPASTTKN
ncbi:MAG: family 43 glycosylhydrolase [Bryocella sp.]